MWKKLSTHKSEDSEQMHSSQHRKSPIQPPAGLRLNVDSHRTSVLDQISGQKKSLEKHNSHLVLEEQERGTNSAKLRTRFELQNAYMSTTNEVERDILKVAPDQVADETSFRSISNINKKSERVIDFIPSHSHELTGSVRSIADDEQLRFETSPLKDKSPSPNYIPIRILQSPVSNEHAKASPKSKIRTQEEARNVDDVAKEFEEAGLDFGIEVTEINSDDDKQKDLPQRRIVTLADSRKNGEKVKFGVAQIRDPFSSSSQKKIRNQQGDSSEKKQRRPALRKKLTLQPGTGALDSDSPKCTDNIRKLWRHKTTIKRLKAVVQQMKSNFRSMKLGVVELMDFNFRQAGRKYERQLVQVFNKALARRIAQSQAQMRLQQKQKAQRTIEELKRSMIEWKTKYFEAQNQLQVCRQQLDKLVANNEALNESLFSVRQKFAQEELIMKRQIENIVAGRLPSKPGVNDDRSELEIRRLSEQVEELNKLCERSQEQYKKALQNERLTLNIELEKVVSKQLILNQKDRLLEQNLEELRKDQDKVKSDKEKILHRQKELTEVQTALKEKLIKIETLQQELASGFQYIEQAKRQNQQAAQKLNQQRKQLQTQRESLVLQVRALELDRKQHHVQAMIQKQKSLPSERIENEGKFYRSLSPNKFKQNGYDHRVFYPESYNQQQPELELKIPNFSQRFIQYGPPRYSQKLASDNQFSDEHRLTQRIMTRNPPHENSSKMPRNSLKANVSYDYVGEPQPSFTPWGQFETRDVPPGRHDRKFLSQVITTEPYPRNSLLSEHQISSPGMKERLSPRNKSPKLASMFSKSRSVRSFLTDNKISELGCKISQLRNEIKTEINAAKLG